MAGQDVMLLLSVALGYCAGTMCFPGYPLVRDDNDRERALRPSDTPGRDRGGVCPRLVR